MKILTLLIRLFKTGNAAIVGLAFMALITAAIWILMFGVTEEAVAQATHETDTQVSQESKVSSSTVGLGLLAAAISTSVSAVAAGIAVSLVGSAALGAVAEKPEIMGRSIIFVGLAEGIAIYGLIISIMILGRI